MASVQKPRINFKSAKTSEVFSFLKCDKSGLSESEARKRLEKYGENAITMEKTPLWKKFLSQFLTPISLLIASAAILSFFMDDLIDSAVIFFLLFMNALISFYIEFKADGAIASLSKKLTISTRVLRNGKWKDIDSEKIVPGDIILLAAGQIVPADAKIISGGIEADQSSLTGESLPVLITHSSLAYASSLVHRGEAKAVVVSTGKLTEFGKVAKLTNVKRPESHLDETIESVSKYLIFLALIGSGIIVATGFFREYSISETALLALTLLVASIPAAMPSVLATIMATGAMSLAAKNVVVRHLSALEELASVSILCSDKTGTLTMNELKAGKPWEYKCTEQELLQAARLCMREGSVDSIDRAIIEKSGKRDRKWKLKKYVAADSQTKHATAYLVSKSKRILIAKGAPQAILPLCKIPHSARATALRKVREFAMKGYRSIAVAQKKLRAGDSSEKGCCLLGIIPLYDPPRADAKAMVRQAAGMGVLIKMVSGDHSAAAKHIARKIGIRGGMLVSKQLQRLKGKDFMKAVFKANVFSEVFPQQKFDIVSALQKFGKRVAVTGDGVNDAPALKRADVGIAVSSANEVAKAASDLVLTKKGISVIIDGIYEGRMIFERMRNYVLYRVAETFRVLFLVPFSVIVLGFFPLLPIQLVALSFLNDLAILSLSTDRVSVPHFPERWRLKKLMFISSSLGFIGLVSSSILLYLAYFTFHLPLEAVQTLLFLKLSISGHFMIFSARERKAWNSSMPSPLLVISVVITQAIATALALLGIFMAPIHFSIIFMMWIYVFIAFLITDVFKVKLYAIADALKL